MNVQDYGLYRLGYNKSTTSRGNYCGNDGSGKNTEAEDGFLESLRHSEERKYDGRSAYSNGNRDAMTEEERESEEEWEKKLFRLDEELEQIRRQNRREQKRVQEERVRKRKIQRKLWEKLSLKKYLARQDEIEQLNEKISLERAFGKDIYIEKPPLSKSLSLAEIRAICSEY